MSKQHKVSFPLKKGITIRYRGVNSAPTVIPELADIADLIDILSMVRCADGQGERELINSYIVPTGAKPDNFGNYILRIGTAPVLWSSHTDTVHRLDTKSVMFRQDLSYDKATKLLTAVNSSCLGADNGVGVWIMLRMIKAGVGGLYIFHRQEEWGGIGSKWIASHTPELVKDIKFAIAFDRRYTSSVITQQGYRTCSDEFADSIIAQLGSHWKKDPTGTFTDTKSYAALIPECTNLSAGFWGEHTSVETLDIPHVRALLKSMLSFDINKLTVSRVPASEPKYVYHYSGYHTQNANPYGYGASTYQWWRRPAASTNTLPGEMDGYGEEQEEEPDDDINIRNLRVELIRRHPMIVFNVLESLGLDDDVLDEVVSIVNQA